MLSFAIANIFNSKDTKYKVKRKRKLSMLRNTIYSFVTMVTNVSLSLGFLPLADLFIVAVDNLK